MVASSVAHTENAVLLTEYGPAPGGSEHPQPAGRAVLGVTVGVLAMLIVFTARADRQAPEPRLGRRIELVELILAEQIRNAQLAQQVLHLRGQLTAFEQGRAKDDEAVKGLRSRVDETSVMAGLAAVEGPGLAVTLNDSVLEQSPTGDPNDLVIHEQDLQGVINALWAGGAEAMSVMGQRVLGTTAIRCVGNTLLLHGKVHSPPYTIAAVGDPAALTAALEQDPAVARFREAVVIAKLGFGVARSKQLKVPANAGGVSLRVARTAGAQAPPEKGGNE